MSYDPTEVYRRKCERLEKDLERKDNLIFWLFIIFCGMIVII